MRTVDLNSISDSAVADEESLLIDMIRAKFPNLDLRRGTVLRDLLVLADAAVGAAFKTQAEEQETRSSLLRMSELEAAGGEVDPDDVAAVLSNFNVEPVAGTMATGYVRMLMSSDRMYQVMEGSVFTTLDGLSFESTSDVVVSPDPSEGESMLETGQQGKWFLVPVRCSKAGSAGNIPQGTTMVPGFDLFGFVSAAAYRTFSGGSDMETLDRTSARIRQALSARGLLTRSSTEAVIRDEFDSTENPVVAVSTCGYGSAAQLRDKHNAFGVAVGGRVDVYVRNFTGIPTAHVTKEGVWRDDADGGYVSLCISPDEAPGMYCVRRVSDPDFDSLSSYQHSERWTDGGSSSTWHDFDVSSDVSELMGTVWRGVEIRVYGVERGADALKFRVELVRLPAADRLQALVDKESVRSTGIDHVVRCPVIIQVSVYAVVRHPYGKPFDVDYAVSKVCEYINTSGFVGRLTRSEISSVLIGLGATSVDLPGDDSMLHGFGYGADGSEFHLSGDALDVADALPGERGMVSRDTAVFVVEPENVVIRTIAE